MKLTELEPRWIHDNLFIFRCPCCRQWWLTAKNVVMTQKEQRELYERVLGDDWNEQLVPSNPQSIWNIDRKEFEGMSVHPSIDASAAGHWHGFITNGEAK